MLASDYCYNQTIYMHFSACFGNWLVVLKSHSQKWRVGYGAVYIFKSCQVAGNRIMDLSTKYIWQYVVFIHLMRNFWFFRENKLVPKLQKMSETVVTRGRRFTQWR
jgi:hypothetical protein